MALVEGGLEYYIQAEAAIALIDDPDLAGVEDLTINHIIDCVRAGFGDVEECKNRLVQECAVCFSSFPRDQVHNTQYKFSH